MDLLVTASLILLLQIICLPLVSTMESKLFNASASVFSYCRYHLFPPTAFDMYTSCLGKHPIDTQHIADSFFLYILQAMNASVPAEDANLFIIPGLYSLSSEDRCRKSHKDNMDQMQSFIMSRNASHPSSKYLLVAVTWRVFYEKYFTSSFLDSMYIGAFELNNNLNENKTQLPLVIPVGYSSFHALKTYRALDIAHPSRVDPHGKHKSAVLPFNKRKYLASFAGFINRDNYKFKLRHWLADFIKANVEYCKNVTDVYLYVTDRGITGKRHRVDGEQVIAESVMVFTLPGDTPTTSRIMNAFESLSLLGCLSHTKATLLPELPFPGRVPWEELIVWVDTGAYLVNPVRALREAVLNMTQEELLRRQEMMLQYRGEVVWMRPESRVHINILEEACSRIHKEQSL